MLEKQEKTKAVSVLNQQTTKPGTANRTNPLLGMDYAAGSQALSTNKGDPKKKKPKDKDKESEAPEVDPKTIEDIATRVRQCFYDQDYFVEVWSVYDPNRVKVSSKQELQLTEWVQFHRGGQTSDIIDQFYQFLAYYPVTFKADANLDLGKGIVQTKEIVELQMWLDEQAKNKGSDVYDIFREYNAAKLTPRQQSFVKKVVDAGFPEVLFFQWLKYQMI